MTSAWPCSLQAPGGAAGEHEKERDGKRPLPVFALRGAARAAGEHLGLLSGLQKGGFAQGLLPVPGSRAAQARPPGLSEGRSLCRVNLALFDWVGAVNPQGFLFLPYSL